MVTFKRKKLIENIITASIVIITVYVIPDRILEWLQKIGAIQFSVLVIALLYVLFNPFRQIIHELIRRIERVSKGSVDLSPPEKESKENNHQPVENVPPESELPLQEIQPDISGLDDENEAGKLIFQMLHADSIELLNATYKQLSSLEELPISDEAKQEFWFSRRATLNDNELEKDLLIVIKKHPNWCFPYLLMAELYLKLGSPQNAEKYRQEAEQRASSNDLNRTFLIKAEILALTESKDEAINYLEDVEAKQWVGKKTQLFQRIAKYQRELKDNLAQQLTLEKALEEDPTNVELRFSLAYSYAENHDTYLLAIYHYNLLLKEEPTHTAALNNMAVLWEKFEINPEYDKYIHGAIDNGDSTAMGNYLSTLVEHGFLIEAEKFSHELSPEDKKNTRVLSALQALNNEKETQQKRTERIIELSQINHKQITSLIVSKQTSPEDIAGTWKSKTDQLILEINSEQNVFGTYIHTNLLAGTLLGKPPTTVNYKVCGSYRNGILILKNAISRASLLDKDKPSFSFWLVPTNERLNGIMWSDHKTVFQVTLERD